MPTPRHQLLLPQPGFAGPSEEGGCAPLYDAAAGAALPPMAVEQWYSSMRAQCVLAVNAPKHVGDAFARAFDGMDLGLGVMNLADGTPRAATQVLLVKPTGGAPVILPCFAGRHVLVLLLDGACRVMASPSLVEAIGMDAGGATAYFPTLAAEGLGVQAEEGCALVVLAWDEEAVGAVFAPASGDACAAARRLAAFPPELASLALGLGEDCAERRAGAVRDAASAAYRHPLLPGTLHPFMPAGEFFALAARQLRPQGVALGDLRLNPKAAAAAAASFQAHGVGWVAPLAAPRLLTACREAVLGAAAATQRTDGIATQADLDGVAYFPVHYRQNRQDVGQRLDGGAAHRVVQQVLPVLAPLLDELLGNARLVEFSCLVSYPGAMGQPPHSDSTSRSLGATGGAHLVSCFIPLVDVEEPLGPLEVWPRTHSVAQLLPDSLGYLKAPGGGARFREFVSEEDERAAGGAGDGVQDPARAARTGALEYPSVKMLVPAGAVVLMDSRCYHRGSANTTEGTPRPVLYFTFASERGALPEGSTYSLIPELRARQVRLFDVAPGAVAPPAAAPVPDAAPASVADHPDVAAVLEKYFKDGDPRAALAKEAVGASRTDACGGAPPATGAAALYEAIVAAQEGCIEALGERRDDAATHSALKWLRREAHRVRALDMAAAAAPASVYPMSVTPTGALVPLPTAAAGAKVIDAGGSVVTDAHPEVQAALASAYLAPEERAGAEVLVYVLAPGAQAPSIYCPEGARTVMVGVRNDVEVELAPARARETVAACAPQLLPALCRPAPRHDGGGGAARFAVRKGHAYVLPPCNAQATLTAMTGSQAFACDACSACSVVVVVRGARAPTAVPRGSARRDPLRGPALRALAEDGPRAGDLLPVAPHEAGAAEALPLVVELAGVGKLPGKSKKKTKAAARYTRHPFSTVRAVSTDAALPLITTLTPEDARVLAAGGLRGCLHVLTLALPDLATRAVVLAPRDAAAAQVCSHLAAEADDALADALAHDPGLAADLEACGAVVRSM
eukprot:TRINITY_DN9291_c0_g1_i1.p1 TRINITY_DN9291_c0_g1~~TRINITY_DN9291_c0_g1_i1.p1  ORF type:complete len:1175 (+),score=366.76 TRINITY_DN9291_c0_g1_i1:457-3525(+)